MSVRKKQMLTLVFLLVMGVVLIVAAVYGVRSSKIKRGDYIEHASQEDTFYSYESVDKRKDGSELSVSFYKSPDGFVMTEVYKDYGNRCAYRHTVLDEESVKLLRKLVSEPFKASTVDESSDVYKKGIVTFAQDGKVSSFSIEPLDLSGFSIKDPDRDPNLTEDRMNLIGDLPDYCDVFDTNVFESFLGFSDKTKLRAYLDSMFRQIADRLIGSEDFQSNLEIASNMIQRILLDHVDDDSYTVLVELEDERKEFTVMKSGYVLEK